MPALCMSADCSPDAPFPGAAHVLGRAAEDVPSTWAPAAHGGDMDGFPGFWLQPVLAQAMVAI